MKLESGNSLSIFFNESNQLLCIDLVDKRGQGGNELVRRTLNQEELLKGVTA
jgi:hypothetical protein